MILVEGPLAHWHQHPSATEVPVVVNRADLARRRWRATAADGTEFGFDLSNRMAAGDVIHRDGKNVYRLELAPEDVIEITWRGEADAAALGWNLGNLHFPIQLAGGTIRVPDDPAVRQFLDRHFWEWRAVKAPFEPLHEVHGHGHHHHDHS